MNSLVLTPDEYLMCKKAFCGGFTHANVMHVNYTLSNVQSYDFTSSYPAVMVSEKFPMSSPNHVKITSKEHFLNLLKKYCCIFTIEFTNIEDCVHYENYLSGAHCKTVNAELNNGRIIRADKLTTTITEQDYFIINKMYKWDSMKVDNFMYFHKNYLPTNFVKAILGLYKDKTELKGVKGKEIEYAKSKEQINSAYGMTVTDIIREDIVYDIDWGAQDVDIEAKISKYNMSRNRFLYYPWGVWVTAYARANLFSAILNIKDDYVYSDTDSVKILNYEKHEWYFKKYNDIILKKLTKACEFHKIPLEYIRPKTIKGVEKILGVWDKDDYIYEKFKTLGAKRYLYLDKDGYTLTVAGLSKKNGLSYLLKQYGESIFENFKEGLYIPAKETGKMTHTYIDEKQEGLIIDYNGVEYEYCEKSSIHLEPAPFDMSLTAEFINLILGVQEVYRL